jgi:hypothetical protein
MLLAAIGNICLQWSLLEQNLLGIISGAEHMPVEKTYTRYGTTDMMPRIRMAIRLTEEAKWPVSLRNRLVAIRRALQKEGGKGLAEYRNLYVHGAHKEVFENGEVELTMVRWPASERSQIVTAEDAVQLGHRLGELAQEAHSIFCDYGTWKFDTKLSEQGRENVAQAKALSRLIRAHQIKRAVKLLFANLKPW